MSHSEEPKPPPKRRVKTPTVLQMEATECGAASLGIVLGYFGRIVPLEELREQCGVSRDGSKAINVVKAARKYGLTTRAFKKQPESLRTMAFPQIVFWNFNHFLVVEGFKGDTVYLNDPASGPRTVTFEEFDHAFTGVVVTFEPNESFVKTGQKPSLLKALWQRLAGSQMGLLFVVLAGLGLVIPGLMVPVFSRIFVDNVLIRGLDGWLGPLLLGMGLTTVITAVLTWLREYYLLRLEMKLSLSMSTQFLWHILRLPIVFFNQRYAGEIGSRVTLNDKVAQLLSGELATTVVNIITVIFFVGLMFWYDVVLTVIGVSLVILNIVALRYVSRRRVDGSQRLLNELGKLMGAGIGGLQTIETIKASGAESDFFARWSGYQAKVINAEQELGQYTELLSAVPPLLTTLNSIAVLAVGGLRVIDGAMTVGTLVAFQALMISFITPFNRLVELGSTLQEIEGDMSRIDDVLRYKLDKQFVAPAPSLPEDGKAASAPPLAGGEGGKLPGHIELKNVTFGYSRLDPPLIEDLNLTLRPGSRVALVGGTGSGKSTVARLVAGLYEVWSGEILFNGFSHSQLPRDLLTNSLSMVDQDIFLFEDSVHNNLTLWDDTILDSTIRQAARDAQIHNVISARGGGYESLVAEGGQNFSGGERQRLEIARALVGNPTILILDEATSALDPLLEQTIDENIRRRGCTTIIVAHRLSTIRDCDEIIVLERGKVVQRGTHDEMVHQDGRYATLIQSDTLKEGKSKVDSILDSLF
ncbi:MAG: NHLP family bacteriocin export ABC transporter peptidase/permease/ATPase subunit [Chloroflexota bacterium]